MVDFRRWITALAVLALFAGLASAQIGTPTGPSGTAPQCNGNFATNAQLRGEGFTELAGDIVITCTNGPVLANGSAIPQTNITVFIGGSGNGGAITSRLLSASNTLPQPSEVLLIIDDPGATSLPATVAGFGPAGPQVLCTTPFSGCAETALVTGGTQVAVNAGSTTQGPNVFQGIVGSQGTNTVQFFGVPILPAGSAGVQHTYRITNIRVSAAGLPNQTQVSAFLTSSNTSAFPVTSTSLLVGTVASPSMIFKSSLVSDTGGFGNPFLQCDGASRFNTASISFTETQDGAAFKTRVLPVAVGEGTFLGVLSDGTGDNIGIQNTPGGVFNNSESGFIFPIGARVAGLADYGTRLKAVFFNIPSGVSIFVPVRLLSGATVGSSATVANLVTSETVSDDTAGAFVTAAGPVQLARDATTNTATAVWEIIQSNANTLESVSGTISISFTPDLVNKIPTPTAAGVGTVRGSYAPEPSQGAFTAATGPTARNTALIPRFTTPLTTNGPFTFITINICQTVLLWPFVTASPGFDTGIAIANTSDDPINKTANAQDGSCTLNWFGTTTAGPAPPPTLGCDQPGAGAVCFPVVKNGTVQATDLLTVLGSTSGFQGYLIAVCNFQFAHGYGAVTDLGVQHLLANYLALVLFDPFAGQLDRGNMPQAEVLAH